MLHVHSGPFHPVLEDALAAAVGRFKSGPFSSMAIIAPSSRLRDRAQLMLSDRGLSILNVHFHTFGSFADAIVAAEGGVPKAKGKKKAPDLISDPLFFDTLVKQILKKDRPFEGLVDLAVPDGFPPSVRATLRDLTDAGVDPDALLEAVNEREQFNIADVDVGSLKQLINLYRLYRARMAELNVASRSRVLDAAAKAAEGSVFLKTFKAVLFYGFYDLTGLQVTLLEAVARHHPTHFFFPYLHKHPDHAFAARFRGDVLDKIPNEEIRLAEAGSPFVTLRTEGKIVRDEGGLFPKTVTWPGLEARIVNVSGLRDEAWAIAGEILRLHDAGVPFSEIGIVSRNRERLSEFASVFIERDVPFVTLWRRSMGDMPQVETGLSILARASGAASAPVVAAEAFFDDTVLPAPWPATASWAETADRAVAALDEHVRPVKDENGRSALLWTELRKATLTLREFDRLCGSVSRDEFLDTLRERWVQWPSPLDGGGIGVAVLHAEAARGLSFDTLFIAGLEERIFPRIIREDPFLRDKTRHAISHTIGNKIGEKMLALDEERLLLHLLLASARRLLFITYQRSDEEGRIVGASSFLRKLIDEWKVPFENAVNVIPRRLGGKLAAAPSESLGARDIISSLLMEDRSGDAAAFATDVKKDGDALRHSTRALSALEKWEGAGPFDGIVGAELGTAHLSAEGMSPSGMEAFFRCPFQYFVRRVLRLSPLREAAALDEVALDVRGTLVHRFLEAFYRRCLEAFGKEWPATPPEKLFDEVFEQAFANRPMEIYPVLWTSVRRALRNHIFHLITADFADLAGRGLVPSAFELPLESSALDPAFGGVRFKGVLDRLDVGEGRARVLDYKTGHRPDGRLSTLVMKGEKAQPTIYLLMAAAYLKEKGIASQIDFTYLFLGEENPVLDLSAADWAAARGEALATAKRGLDMIRAGSFPINPGRHCDYCEAATICRRTDSISAFRGEPDTLAFRAAKAREKKETE